MKREWVAGLAGVYLVAALCAGETAVDGNGIALAPCHVERLAEQVLCGVHEVHEDRDAMRGRRIPIHVAVLPALRRGKHGDPLFLLAGGPGQGARSYAAGAARFLRRVRRTRDIVLVDLRGTGASHPLECPEPADDLAALGTPLGPELARRCLGAIDADVRRYTHREALADLNEIRRLLGYDRINLWGGSWGTRAALLYATRYPGAVRALVLDGAAPLALSYPLDTPIDAQRALDLLFEACEREAACRAAFPGLRGALASLLARLEREPSTLRIRHPRTGAPGTVTLTRASIAEMIRVFLYSPAESRLLPAIIDRAAHGDAGPLVAQVVQSAAWSTDTMALGTTLAILCTEDIGAIDAARIDEAARGSFLGGAGIAGWRDACAAWPRGQGIENAPVRPLDIPALILSGGIDPVTPPRWGEAMARHFTSSVHLVANGAGHNVSFSGCVPDVIAGFIENAAADAAGDSCVDAVAPPPFVTSHAGTLP